MSSTFHPSVSVVIKTYDDSITAGRRSIPLKETLVVTLRALAEQTLRPHEILVIDSSAGEGIAEMIRAHAPTIDIAVRRVPLAPESFNHPRALNLGIQHAQGDVVASLSGDATPANDSWLENLVAPLADPKVGGAFGRHVARPGMSIPWAERFRLWWRYRSRSTKLRYTDHVFANANSAFPHSLALEVPFDETLTELEDYRWAGEVQRQGYAIAYVGSSEVFHSHTTSSLRTLWRMVYYIWLRMQVDAKLHAR